MSGVPRGIRTPVTAVKGRIGNSQPSVVNYLQAITRCNLPVCVTTAVPDSSQVIEMAVSRILKAQGAQKAGRR